MNVRPSGSLAPPDPTHQEIGHARLLASVFDHGPVGIAFRDLEGYYLRVNQAFADTLGRTVDELVGSHFDEFLEPSLRDELRERNRRLLATGEPVRSEVSDLTDCPDHPARLYSAVSNLIRDASGEPLGISVFLVDISERRRIEEELQASRSELSESQARLQALLDHAPMPISMRGPDGRFVLANRPFAELWSEPVDRAMVESERRVLEGAQAVSFEVTAPSLAYPARDYLMTSYPVLGHGGEVLGVGGIALDITDRKHAELSAGRLAAIVASTSDAVIGKTLAGEVISWNAAAERIYGYTAREAIGRHIGFLSPPGVEHEIDLILERVRSGDPIERLETVRRRKDGIDIDVSLTISPVLDGAGEIVGAASITRDITEQKALAARLQSAEELYRTTTEYAPIGIALADLEGRWIKVNRALCEMLGYEEQELLALDFKSVTHPQDRESSIRNVKRLVAGEIERIDVEKRYLRSDGTTVWVHLTSSLARDGTGRPTHAVSLLLDITRRRQDAERLATHAREQDALRSLATLVASEVEPRLVFATAAQRAGEVLQADYSGICRLEPSGQARLVGSWAASGLLPIPLGSPIDHAAATAMATALRTGKPARIDRYDPGSSHAGTAIRSGVAAPIEVNGSLWGAVSAGWVAEDGADDRASERIHRIADLVSLAVTGAESREQLSRLASTDHLTGLHNHRAFTDRLIREVERALRHDRPLSLIVLDIDHFKLVNDTHGHEAGNRVLVEFARRLRLSLREGEELARVGGEEFAWILPNTAGNDALVAAERARHAVAELPFDRIGALTTSAGICTLGDAEDAEDLFRKADLALYWAKAGGRNKSVRYTAGDSSRIGFADQGERLGRLRTLAALRGLATAVDAKDPSTLRHSERVAELAGELARAAGWSDESAAQLADAALVHDVGKIAVPRQILLKPTSLTPAEYEQIKAHSAFGADMLEGLLEPEQVTWIRHHHERFDGSGYPDGLAGLDIPEGARLLTAADAWDAMTAPRSYGSGRSCAGATEEVRRNAGSQFCPRAAELLIALKAPVELG